MVLPVVSGRDVVKALSKAGFIVVGRKGSHIRLKKKNERTYIVIVPDHKELAKGTLKSILRQANLSREQFIEFI
ncbi:type II toxin-antitoxin system HicA family toxin [Candidatus Bathyarchaeota archaeon]|nr:type II toxin-antitoxin system HicA family toxin [Candidatus Bathyarchaeota archaeon]